MKAKFLAYLKEYNLFNPDEKILLTVSGGIDSMTMLHLFMDCGFNFAIAHCNFCLRDAESDGDQEFIERFAQSNKISIHINRFNTLAFAESNKLSIQMAARELRYTWFERLANENNYSKIATAHNTNDVAETFFINLTRGTGIHGLTGINIINGKIIRPLLFATRMEITEYANENSISYREDSSNSEIKYLRNTIRHNIMPLFEKLNPGFLKNITHTTSILKDAEEIYNKNIDRLNNILFQEINSILHLSFTELRAQNVTSAQLYEIIQPYGFSYDTAIKMLKNLDSQPGAIYFSKSHKIVKDRSSYIFLVLTDVEHEEYTIELNQTQFRGVINLQIDRKIIDKNFVLQRNRTVGTFDAEKLVFPLKLRRWKHGDHFFPFGMRGKKKLSNYFNDQKISIPEKENTWLLCSGEDIIWVINHRTDNRYSVTKSTTEVMQFELIN